MQELNRSMPRARFSSLVEQNRRTDGLSHQGLTKPSALIVRLRGEGYVLTHTCVCVRVCACLCVHMCVWYGMCPCVSVKCVGVGLHVVYSVCMVCVLVCM